MYSIGILYTSYIDWKDYFLRIECPKTVRKHLQGRIFYYFFVLAPSQYIVTYLLKLFVKYLLKLFVTSERNYLKINFRSSSANTYGDI